MLMTKAALILVPLGCLLAWSTPASAQGSRCSGAMHGVYLEPDPRDSIPGRREGPCRLRNGNSEPAEVHYRQWFWNSGPNIPPGYPTEDNPERTDTHIGLGSEPFFLGYELERLPTSVNTYHYRWVLMRVTIHTGPRANTCVVEWRTARDAAARRSANVIRGRYFALADAEMEVVRLNGRARIIDYSNRTMYGTYIATDAQERAFCEGPALNPEPDKVCVVTWQTVASARRGHANDALSGRYHNRRDALAIVTASQGLARIVDYTKRQVRGQWIISNAQEERFCHSPILNRGATLAA